MEEENDNDNTRLLDQETSEDSENEAPRKKVVSIQAPPHKVPVVRKEYSTHQRRHPADIPYSIEENSASEIFRIPEKRSRHYPERPQRRKCFAVVRWTLGILILLCLLMLAVAGVVLVLIAPDLSKPPWWTSGIIYQCYPQSFQDSNGDGIGDLEGIRKRIGYFSEIGVKGVWLNPIFDSPQRDNGYDVSNYTDIYKKYGTLDDFKTLLKDLHDNDLHLLLDFVPNHSSDQHPWFKESRSNKTNSKRDWYIWASGRGNEPPNNWIGVFGGSAWTYDNTTGQWYLHQFSSYQPDLNWRNPNVIKAMNDVLRFWLDMGVDGFRVDAVKFLLEDPKLRNETHSLNFNDSVCIKNISNPICYNSLVHNLTTDYKGIHDITREWKSIIDQYSKEGESPKLLIGEIYDDINAVVKYYGSNNNEFDFPFNFFLLDNTNWTGNAVACIITQWIHTMPSGAIANWVLGNHDNPRIASKAGIFRAKALNLLLLTLPGTVTTYYGEEIMMTDVDIASSQRKDNYTNRDPERTPMQWNYTANGGFTTGTPWLPLAKNYSSVNVEVESSIVNKTSMLHLYKELAVMRNTYKAFIDGNYTCINATNDVLIFVRYSTESDNTRNDTFVIFINFSKKNVTTSVDLSLSNTVVMLSSFMDRTGEIDLESSVPLRSGEGLVVIGTQSTRSRQELNSYGRDSKCNFCSVH